MSAKDCQGGLIVRIRAFFRRISDISGWRQWCAGVSLVLVAGCAGTETPPAGSASGFHWRQFQGAKLRVLLVQSHWQQVVVKYLSEFEDLTGIRLETEVLTQEQLWNRLETDLTVPGRVDAFSVVPGLEAVRLKRNQSIQPVNTFLADRTLTAPDYQWEDFLPRFRDAMEVEGAILGPPVMVEHLSLLYRKDLFAQHQVAVPRTLDELEAAARFLHKKPMGPQGASGVGIVSRGQGLLTTGLYASLLHAMGGTWLDERRRPMINSPQSLAALEWMSRLYGRYAPPDVSTFGWQEASTLFLQGRAAMYVEGSSIYPLIEDSASKVARQVGYALFPSGPGGSGATVAARGLAIAKRSAHPEAAWLFVQWASGQGMVRKALVHGVLVARASTWRDQDARSEIPPDLADTLQEAGRTGVIAWAPPVVAVTSARAAVGQAITTALQGGNIPDAANRANRELEDIMAKTENTSAAPRQ